MAGGMRLWHRNVCVGVDVSCASAVRYPRPLVTQRSMSITAPVPEMVAIG